MGLYERIDMTERFKQQRTLGKSLKRIFFIVALFVVLGRGDLSAYGQDGPYPPSDPNGDGGVDCSQYLPLLRAQCEIAKTIFNNSDLCSPSKNDFEDCCPQKKGVLTACKYKHKIAMSPFSSFSVRCQRNDKTKKYFIDMEDPTCTCTIEADDTLGKCKDRCGSFTADLQGEREKAGPFSNLGECKEKLNETKDKACAGEAAKNCKEIGRWLAARQPKGLDIRVCCQDFPLPTGVGP
jgi:hypothetical protein